MAYIKGRWSWKGIVENTLDRGTEVVAAINFSSNNEDFSSLVIRIYAIPTIVEVFYDDIQVQCCYLNDVEDENKDGDYEEDAELNEAYRVMDFGENEKGIDDEIYDFIVNNAEFIPTTIADKLEVIAQNQQKVYDAGKKAEYDALWDAIKANGTRSDYARCFLKWSCEYLHPKYKVVPTTKYYNVIYDCDNLKKIEAEYFDFSKAPYGENGNNSHSYQFATCSKLEEIEDVGLQPSISYSWFAAFNIALKKVACIRVDENTSVDYLLYQCYALEDVTIEGTIGKSGINMQYSEKLSKASIESFVNALSDTAADQSITFSKAAVDEAFFGYGAYVDEETNEVIWQYDLAGSLSVEWSDLVTSKQNWTITLV